MTKQTKKIPKQVKESKQISKSKQIKLSTEQLISMGQLYQGCNENNIFMSDTYPFYFDDILYCIYKLPSIKQINYVKSLKLNNYQLQNLYLLTDCITWWLPNEQIIIQNVNDLSFYQLLSEQFNKNISLSRSNLNAYKNNIKQYIIINSNESDMNNFELINKSKPFIQNNCKYCSLNDKCDKKQYYNKILPITSRIVRYAYINSNQKGMCQYPNKGNWQDQSYMFNNLHNFAISQIITHRNNKMKQMSKSKK